MRFVFIWGFQLKDYILLVNKLYSPDVGGIETVVKDYADGYVEQGKTVKVLCISKQPTLRTDIKCVEGVEVIRCSSFGTYFSMPLSISFIFRLLILMYNASKVVVHVPFPLVDIMSPFFFPFRKKIIVVWHSDIVKQRIFKKFLMPFTYCLLWLASGIATTSPRMIPSSHFLAKFRNKVVIVPLSTPQRIDDGVVGADYLDVLSNINQIHFCIFGRLCYYKGVDVVLQAIRQLHNKGVSPVVVFAGVGELSSKIHDAAGDLSNIYFLERFLSESEKNDLLSKSKCFLFPSVEKSEAFGITQLEALSLGVPVINTYLPTGVPWVSINEMTGLTVEPKNAQQLADAMVNILQDPDRYARFSKEAIARANNVFSRESIRKQQVKLLEY